MCVAISWKVHNRGQVHEQSSCGNNAARIHYAPPILHFMLCFLFNKERGEGKGKLTTSFDAHVRKILIKAPNGRKWCTPSTQGIQRAAKGNKNSIDDQQNTTWSPASQWSLTRIKDYHVEADGSQGTIERGHNWGSVLSGWSKCFTPSKDLWLHSHHMVQN